MEVAYKHDPTLIQRKLVSESELQVQMVSPQALVALEVGLQVGRVKQALKEKLEQTGTGFSTSDALIEATLNLQRDEEDSLPDTQIAREVAQIIGKAVDDATCKPPSDERLKTEKVLTLEEENRLLREARLCKICMDNEVGIVFLPCGHLATCVNCASNLQDCPVCRSAIKATVRTFLS